MAILEMTAPLPIDAILPRLLDALRLGTQAVLVAPPGAGKTTRLPLALLQAPWLLRAGLDHSDFNAGGSIDTGAIGRIVLVEPRRLAARAAAARMAATLGEAVGQTIGLAVRFGAAGSAATRITVMTEGVFVAMIGADPALDGVAAVLFDEFHERALGADLGLALALDARALRPDLRLVVMSATLDGARVAALMDRGATPGTNASSATPVIESRGRAFPVATRYGGGRRDGERIEDAVLRAILRALGQEDGSLLVFLPGQAEITRVAERLGAADLPAHTFVAPLFAAMDRRAQDAAVAPTPPGQRKIVLATSVAETSLTIAGVRIVIDCGLARVPRYEPALGLTRLETQRVSRAAADQRRGRAGRTEPGVCYRLWEEAANGALEPFNKPAILSADLSGLLLDCAAWGARRPERDLLWLDPPPGPALAAARTLLVGLDALDGEGGLTATGRAIRALALPPRLARMVVDAAVNPAEVGLAAAIAVVVVERGIGGEDIDLRERLRALDRDRSPRADEARQLARGLARQAVGGRDADWDFEAAGRHLAVAFPDRIAKARGRSGEFLMANGRAGMLDALHPLARAPFLVVADVAGRAGAARILLAAPLDESMAVAAAIAAEELRFDPARAALTNRCVWRLGALVLREGNAPVPATAAAAAILAAGLAEVGVARLPWTPAQRQWRDRVAFLRAVDAEGANAGVRSADLGAPDLAWPDLSDAALATDGAPWLAAHLVGIVALDALDAGRLQAALDALLPWQLARRLDAEAPALFDTPAGAAHRLDYGADGGPTLSVKVQELYGVSRHPSVVGGRVPLVLALLSPAGRPIQITRDLPGFWRGSWASVRSEMRGRYPKHVWPEDPAAAAATLRAKPRAAPRLG